MNLGDYSGELVNAIQISQALAKENSNETFSPAHLLKALMHKDIGLRDTLKNLQKDIFFIEEWAEVRIEAYRKSSKVPEQPPADKDAIAVLNEATNLQIKLGSDKIEPMAVFIAIATPGVGFNYEQLKSFPVTPAEMLDGLMAKASLVEAVGGSKGDASSGMLKNSSLLKYAFDKIEYGRLGKLEKTIGRDKEIRTIAEILGRRTNSNVLIIGDPGVGKTAVINGFCQLIADKKASDWINNLQVFELSLGNLLAGASYKGEVEDRLYKMFSELSQFDKAVLIIENIHEFLDKQGSAPGAINVFKQELSKGVVTLLASSTIDSYTKVIERDNSFKRFFEVIKIEEPADNEVYTVLSKVIPDYYEKHHSLKVDEEPLREAIRLSRRYLKERSLPSAAIDLIDRTMSVVRASRDFARLVLDDIQARKEAIKINPDDPNAKPAELLEDLKQKLNPVILAQLNEEIEVNKFSDPQEQLAYLEALTQRLEEALQLPKEKIENQDIAAVISQKTNIPIGKLQGGEREKLLNAEEFLTRRVVGQDHALKSIIEAVLESRSGINKAGQPIGSFFFLGPTGTGKTELAKALADFLFNDENAMIRFDMSEFKEEHSAALLYGAPPGYVGYEEGGMLVNKIRQRPYAVVLFDEIEKAHASVFDIFLQILDEGKLHDRLGKVGDFSNALIIFTSNIGSKFIVDEVEKGIIPASNVLMEIMAKNFRPEFLGRLTEIVPFVPIQVDVAIKILEINLKILDKTLVNKNIKLTVTQEAKEKLAVMGFNPQYGARPLIGIIRSQLRRPLSRKLISGEISENSAIELDYVNEEFIWKS
ncbi:MAG: ATP-dependent Clp protease ATP-binding subunit [Bacteroidetes bacterium]|nr:ATP-dependent Clp protease ATP-binding subunit [Bacteroidota bacterium]